MLMLLGTCDKVLIKSICRDLSNICHDSFALLRLPALLIEHGLCIAQGMSQPSSCWKSSGDLLHTDIMIIAVRVLRTSLQDESRQKDVLQTARHANKFKRYARLQLQDA